MILIPKVRKYIYLAVKKVMKCTATVPTYYILILYSV
jgi:hypothetical protein